MCIKRHEIASTGVSVVSCSKNTGSLDKKERRPHLHYELDGGGFNGFMNWGLFAYTWLGWLL